LLTLQAGSHVLALQSQGGSAVETWDEQRDLILSGFVIQVHNHIKSELVGGFKHFLFSIMYGIILPND
jgi:hypothetical protein